MIEINSIAELVLILICVIGGLGAFIYAILESEGVDRAMFCCFSVMIIGIGVIHIFT